VEHLSVVGLEAKKRNEIRTWSRFMNANPVYFTAIFGKEATLENIASVGRGMGL